MKFVRSITVLLAFGLGTAASAQDAMMNNWGGNWATGTINRNVRDTLLGVGGSSRAGNVRTAPVRSPFVPVRPGLRATAFPYASTAASQKVAARGLIARLSRSNPAAAKSVSAEMGRHDFFRIYTTLIADTPYHANDAADTLAAYLVLGYVIVNGGDSTAPQERAVRTQVALRAAGNPSFAPGRRTQLAEDLKLLFVTVHGGWQTARRQGSQRQYAGDVAKLFQASNIDLRALRLTEQGFVAR